MTTFNIRTHGQQIIFGQGSLSKLATAVEKAGWQRVMLCASPSLSRQGLVAAIQESLGKKCVAVYDATIAHVQDYQLEAAFNTALKSDIDAVIGFGGGSPVGMAKAISLNLEEKRTGVAPGSDTGFSPTLIPVIAIPTTYAGSEMTPIYGVTHNDGASRKITVRDPRSAPLLVIYDPDLTVNLPTTTTASSGINALAHCIEALYSSARSPLATAAAQSAITYITRALPRCTADGTNLEARTEMLIGAHLAAYALSLTTMGLHHGLCHVLGGGAGVPHGIANSIMLPHAMRFNLDATIPQLALVAQAMDASVNGASIDATAEAAVDGIFAFIGQLGLPQRLRDVGVKEEDIPRLAELALSSHAVKENPKPVTDTAQTESVFRAAW